MAGLGVNALTTSAYCPQSQQPELKHAAVRLERAELPWQLVAAAWLPQDEALALRERLRGLFGRFGYAVCVPFGREPQPRIGVLFRARGREARARRAGRAGSRAAACEAGAVLRYADARAGQHARDAPARRRHACRPSCWPATPRRRAGCSTCCSAAQPAAAFGRALLAARRQPPQPVAPRSRQVCACHDVSEEAIVAAAARQSAAMPASACSSCRRSCAAAPNAAPACRR